MAEQHKSHGKHEGEDLRPLVDEVMRGERPLLFPPGTLAAALIVPLLVVGVVPLVLAIVFAGNREVRHPGPFVVGMGVALLLVVLGAAGNVMVFRGRSSYGMVLLTSFSYAASASFVGLKREYRETSKLRATRRSGSDRRAIG